MNRAGASVARAGAAVRGLSTAAAAPKDSLWAVRSLGSVGPWMRDIKPVVVAEQAFFTRTTGPTFVKKDTDKFVMAGVFLSFVCGSLLVSRGASAAGWGAAAPLRPWDAEVLLPSRRVRSSSALPPHALTPSLSARALGHGVDEEQEGHRIGNMKCREGRTVARDASAPRLWF